MTESGEAARNETLARLAQSRAEIRHVLEPPPRVDHDGGEEEAAGGSHGGAFPRSRTMRLLMSGRGIGTLGAVIGGLVLARPALASRLLRMFPTGAVARLLMVKALTALRAKHP